MSKLNRNEQYEGVVEALRQAEGLSVPFNVFQPWVRDRFKADSRVCVWDREPGDRFVIFEEVPA